MVVIDLFLLTFYGELGTGCYLRKKFIKWNSFDEGFLCDNSGLARLSVEFNDQR